MDALRTAEPTLAPAPDLVAAIDLVTAVLDGQPLLPRIDPRNGARPTNVIGGLVVLACVLGERIVGPDRPDVFKAALVDLQVHARLEAMFGSNHEEKNR